MNQVEGPIEILGPDLPLGWEKLGLTRREAEWLLLSGKPTGLSMKEFAFHVGNRLDEIQKEHEEWRLKNFGGPPNSDDAFLGMVEELGELAHHLLKLKQGIRGTITDEHIKDDIGDLLIFTIQLCNAGGYSIYDILEDTWAKVKQRDWKKDKEKGGEHD